MIEYDFNFLLEMSDLELVNQYNLLVTHKPNDDPDDKLNDVIYRAMLTRYLGKTFKSRNYNLEYISSPLKDGFKVMHFKKPVYLEVILGIKTLKPIDFN
ncbi:hypothetical protein [Moheibacter lacus]|uniref:Uncharacterized protein n=1 Tax=Moheibacter lacus TaxID=2745851 RepID=A0A838ZQ89_9FLAO|nr:hypothetical protein [Moheibacter lacus]MBA5629887.1 hypothetical protein [Moheibacter lacus]